MARRAKRYGGTKPGRGGDLEIERLEPGRPRRPSEANLWEDDEDLDDDEIEYTRDLSGLSELDEHDFQDRRRR